jgi:putative transcriptional regulator
MGKMFDLLNEALDEAIEYEQGKKTLRTKRIPIPEKPSQYRSKDVKRLRKKMKCSQPVFAIIIGVSDKTIKAWESGERKPNSTANRLLEAIEFEEKRKKFFNVVDSHT